MGKDAKVATKSGITEDLRIGDKIIGGEVFAYLFIGDIEGLSCEKNYLSDFPKERADEILSSKSEKVRRQKTAVWKLLLFAAKEVFGLSAKEIRFEKAEKGKWLCDKFWFSLSHTDGAAVVVIAEKPCGTDIEYVPKFFEKAAYKSFISSFLRQIGENGVSAQSGKKRTAFNTAFPSPPAVSSLAALPSATSPVLTLPAATVRLSLLVSIAR